MFKKIILGLFLCLSLLMIGIGVYFFLNPVEQETVLSEEERSLLYNDMILGNKEEYQEYLNQGNKLNFRFEDGTTPIEILVESNDIQGAKKIIESGFNVTKIEHHNPIDTVSNVIFYNESFRKDEINGISYKLIEQVKNNIEQPDSYGMSLLMNAISTNNLAVVNELLKYDLNLNQSYNGTTALHIACETTGIQLEIVKRLIEEGAHPSQTDQNGNNSIFSAIDYGQLYLVKYLIEHTEIDLNVQNNYGDTILHHALYSNLDIANYLVENQVINFSIKNNEGKTAKDIALELNYLIIAKKL